jgi:hypothetical protein
VSENTYHSSVGIFKKYTWKTIKPWYIKACYMNYERLLICMGN